MLRRILQAIQAAISQAFNTPEIRSMFDKKRPDLLRDKMASLQVRPLCLITLETCS
jgi:hypothetical protein